uniref:Uncharacterized protein n=1 Tax=Romanomermis culicivorax TaxID=13658 RepID=A0A915KT07_ROMCU
MPQGETAQQLLQTSIVAPPMTTAMLSALGQVLSSTATDNADASGHCKYCDYTLLQTWHLTQILTTPILRILLSVSTHQWPQPPPKQLRGTTATV